MRKQFVLALIMLVIMAPLLVVVAYIIHKGRVIGVSDMFSDINVVVNDSLNFSNSKSVDANTVMVDTVDDLKALGYTGQNKIAINSSGEIFTTYRKKYDGELEPTVSKVKINGTSFEILNTDPITESDDTQRVPSIEITPNGVVHVTWYGLTDDEDDGRQIFYSKSTDEGNTWTAAINPQFINGYEDDDYWQEHPYIFAANDNDLYIVWEGKDSKHEEQQIKLTFSRDGGNTWSNWRNVNPSPESTQSRPYLISDDAGILHLFMYSSRTEDSQQIWHSTSADGEAWSDWNRISDGLDESRHVSVVNIGDKLLAVWRSKYENRSQLFSSIYSDGEWSGPALVSESTEFQFFPVLGKNNNNEIGLVWVETVEKSEFPRDDPQNAKGYFAKFDESLTKIGEKQLIAESKAKVFYPHLPYWNKYDDKFYILYGEENEDLLDIKLSVVL